MNRFDQFTSQFSNQLSRFVGIQKQYLGLELGSSQLRLIRNGTLLASIDTTVFRHPSGVYLKQATKEATRIRAIEKGVVSDQAGVQYLIEQLFKKALIKPAMQHQYQVFCIVPSNSTVLESTLFEQAMPTSPWIQWQFIPKVALHETTLQQHIAEDELSGVSVVIDIGADVTELCLGNTAHTIYWGTNDLERALQLAIRDEYQVHLSQETMKRMFVQLGSAIFSKEQSISERFAVRAQSLASGKPTTVTLELAKLQAVFQEWFLYLTSGLQVVLNRGNQNDTYEVLEKGIVVVGGGAMMADLVPVLATFFQVPTTSVPDPRLWFVKGLTESVMNVSEHNGNYLRH